MNTQPGDLFDAMRYGTEAYFKSARISENEMYHPYTNTHPKYIVFQDGAMRTGVTNPSGLGTYRRLEKNTNGVWQMRVKRRAGGQKWKYVPREQLPKEISTWLLIMDIPDGP